MSGPNFWNNGIPAVNADLIPWGTYNIGSSTPDIQGWLDDYGPTGSDQPYSILLQPNQVSPGPLTTLSLSFDITSAPESTDPCWGTLWFAFIPFNMSTGKIQGGNSKSQSRIYLLAIDASPSNNQSGWYYLDQLSQAPTFVSSLHIGTPPPVGGTMDLWVYMDYGKQMAYAGMGQGISVGTSSIDKGKGVNLSKMLGSSDGSNFGYLLAFIKQDAGDPTSSSGGVGPVRTWTDPVACCMPGGAGGNPPGSMDCSSYSPGTSGCDNAIGTDNGDSPSGYCGANVTDTLCACVNGDLGTTALNYCFMEGCDKGSAYYSAPGNLSCNAECVDVLNVQATGNVDWGKVENNCQTNPYVIWIEDNWQVSAVAGAGLVFLLGVLWMFWSGWL